MVAGGYRLVGTASASPCGELTIIQLPPPARVPNKAQPPSAVRPTGLKPPRNARMAAVWAMHQGPAWARRWSLPAPQPFGDSGPSTAHRAAVPHCSRRYGYYQVVGNWWPSMSKSTGPCAGMTIRGGARRQFSVRPGSGTLNRGRLCYIRIARTCNMPRGEWTPPPTRRHKRYPTRSTHMCPQSGQRQFSSTMSKATASIRPNNSPARMRCT